MEIMLSISSKAGGNGREVPCAIGDGLIVGRGAEQGILLDGPDLSREHLLLTTDGTNVYVTDLSSNGTWLNGTRLRRSVRSRARAEDTIEVPGYVLKFRSADTSEKTPDAPKEKEAVAKVPEPVPQDTPVGLASAELSKPHSALELAFQFVGSFTFGEKFLIFAGVLGLILVYTYLGS